MSLCLVARKNLFQVICKRFGKRRIILQWKVMIFFKFYLILASVSSCFSVHCIFRTKFILWRTRIVYDFYLYLLIFNNIGNNTYVIINLKHHNKAVFILKGGTLNLIFGTPQDWS